jgi:hypothetical protein
MPRLLWCGPVLQRERHSRLKRQDSPFCRGGAKYWKVDPQIDYWYADGTYVAKEHLWFVKTTGANVVGNTHRLVIMSAGPDGAGFEIDNLFSPDDDTVEIGLNNDTGFFTNDADNLYQDRLMQLLWSA